jgi:hypothetical protein
VGCALFAGACLNPNTYSTPRTTPAGKVQHAMALEIISYRDSYRDGETSQSVHAQTFLAMPTYALRVGASDNLDIGMRIGNGSSPGVDAKWNFLKSKYLDAAAGPGLQTFYFWAGAGGDGGAAHFYGNLPLMLGINASETFSVVPSVGLGYGFGGDAAAVANNAQERAAAAEALLLQAGIGLDFRTSRNFAIHPEMSLLRRLSGPADAEMTWFTFGLGFDWGALPSYESAP